MAGSKKAKRELTEVVAYEVSLVDYPANELPFIKLVRSARAPGVPVINQDIIDAQASLLARQIEGAITKAATEPKATATSLRALAKSLDELAGEIEGEPSGDAEADEAGEQDPGATGETLPTGDTAAAQPPAGEQEVDPAVKKLLDALLPAIDARITAAVTKAASKDPSTPAAAPKIPPARVSKAKPVGSNALGSDGAGDRPEAQSPWTYDLNDPESPRVN